MATDGNPFGILLWFFAVLFIIGFRWKQLPFAYKEGISLVTTMQHRLESLTNAKNINGCLYGRGPRGDHDSCEICI
nr:PTS system mannose/fructose/sorbose family transporter subunit IID [Staphylococcus pseudintermedius]